MFSVKLYGSSLGLRRATWVALSCLAIWRTGYGNRTMLFLRYAVKMVVMGLVISAISACGEDETENSNAPRIEEHEFTYVTGKTTRSVRIFPGRGIAAFFNLDCTGVFFNHQSGLLWMSESQRFALNISFDGAPSRKYLFRTANLELGKLQGGKDVVDNFLRKFTASRELTVTVRRLSEGNRTYKFPLYGSRDKYPILKYCNIPQVDKSTGKYLFVTGSSVNVRGCAAKTCSVLMRVKRGQQVSEISQANDWVEIALHGSSDPTGWIHSSLLSASRP